MVELRNVTKRFAGFTAVDNVSLLVQEGEFLTLLGPSGCGKTTMLRMISGFEVPTEGKVLLGGEDVTFLPPYRRNVNQVFQSYALFPHLSVWDNIAFGLRMQHTSAAEIDRRVKESVDLVSLTGMERRKPHELSGGQRQRVALARAIVCQPKVLLLDEPLSALDAKLRHAMQVELKQLQTSLGITFVFVTHDQEEALTMSDRIAVINKGKIEQIGTVSEIYDEPKTTFVANFIGQANILESSVLRRNGEFVEIRVSDALNLKMRAKYLEPDAGESILISIRPEKIHLQRSLPEGENVFEATVNREYFKGPTDLLHITTPAGLELSVVVANESASQEQFHAGDKIYCHLHPDDIVVVQQDY